VIGADVATTTLDLLSIIVPIALLAGVCWYFWKASKREPPAG